MTLVTYARYVQLTGDATTAVTAVEAALVDSEREVARVLHRVNRDTGAPMIALGTYTERLTVHPFSRTYPHAVPVTSVPASASYAVEDPVTIRYASRDDFTNSPVGFADLGEWDDMGFATRYQELYGLATVTYTGGWSAANVPYPIERCIAWVAMGMAVPGSFGSSRAANVKSVSLEGVSVSYDGALTTSGGLDDFWPGAVNSIAGFRWRDGAE